MPGSGDRRRLRRLACRRMDAVAQHLDRLQRDAPELRSLYQDFLIRVTSFFRDPSTFDALAMTVVPRLLEGRNRGDHCAQRG